MATNRLTLYEASNFMIEVSSDGSTWHELIGASAWTPSGGEADSREVDAFGRSARVTGNLGVPTYEVDAAAPAVGTAGWTIVYNAYIGSSLLQFRGTFSEVLVAAEVSGRTAAITTAGAVTLAGSGTHPLAAITEGQAFKIGGKDYRISAISGTIAAATNSITVYPAPGSAVAAADYTLVVPSIRESVSNARVGVAGNFTVTTGAELATALTINPQGRSAGFQLVNPPG